MKFTKRIKTLISTALSLVMVASLLGSFAAFAADDGSVQINEDALSAYSILKAVGAMAADEVPYSDDTVITRAHFVKLALHASNDAPKVLLSNDEVFYDVDMNTQYENYIETAFRIGYISGSSNGLFEPENPVTLAQAVKILCNILGYEKVAEANGGYPGGYLIAAQRIDLLDGVNVNDNEALNMANTMILLENAVNCDLMQIVAIGNDTETKAFDGQTLLTERHSIGIAEGIIESNSYTDLYAQESELEKGYVAIDGVTYKASNDVQDCIGYDVKLYYDASEGSNDREVLYVELSEENSVITANGRDLAVSGDEIDYYTENSSKKIKLADFTTCIINGKMAVIDYEDLENVTKGEITFISNDGNSAVDVIKVTRYDTFVVQGVSASSNLIITKDGVQMEFDPDSDEYTFEIYKNSNPATIADIAAGDIILVCEGEGSGITHKKVLASNKTVTAAFEEIGDETALVQGTEYRVDGINVSEITTGKTYKIMFDALDNISYIEFDRDVVYGYLYGLAQSGMDDPQCRIFTENDRWVDLTFAKKVEYNGERNVPGEEVYADLKADENFRQLIRYNVNSDAEVIMLETAKDISLGSKDADGDGIDEEAQAIENDTFRLAYKGTAMYRNTPKSFNGIFFLDSAAKIFIIPADMSMDKFAIKSRDNLSNDTNYTITAYDINEYLNCDVMTMSEIQTKSVTSDDKFMLVKGVGQILDSEGSAAPSIKGWWTGIEMSFAVKVGEDGVSEDSINALKKGDVINFKYDEDGNITSLKSYPVDEKYYVSGGLYNYTTVISGIVRKCDFENRRIKLEYAAGTEAGITYNASTPVYIWETDTETYRRASTAEFLEGDKIVANMRYLVCQEIIIVR